MLAVQYTSVGCAHQQNRNCASIYKNLMNHAIFNDCYNLALSLCVLGLSAIWALFSNLYKLYSHSRFLFLLVLGFVFCINQGIYAVDFLLFLVLLYFTYVADSYFCHLLEMLHV
jgi:hypothetical protein